MTAVKVPARFVALAATDVLLAAAGRTRERWLTKPLVVPALLPGRDQATRRALVLGAAGDVALLGSGPVAFSSGLGCFLAGHLAWVAALRERRRRGSGRRGRAAPAVAAAYGVTYVGLNAYLWPRTGRDRWPVVAYSTALLATALTALDCGDRRAAWGGALFLTSDALLALERFGDARLPGHEAWVMSTYAAAQALLAAGGGDDQPAGGEGG